MLCSSNVAVTDDLDAFRAVLRPRDSDITRTGRGHFAATHARVDLHRLWMQGADESLSRIWETSLSQRRHSFVFLAQPDHAMILSGTEIGSDDLGLYHASETMVCHRLLGPTRWGSLSLSAEDWQNIGIPRSETSLFVQRIVQRSLRRTTPSTS